MKTFFADIRSGNTQTVDSVQFDAPDIQQAMQCLHFFTQGYAQCGFKLEVQSISEHKTKGRKYVRLG